MKALTKMKRSGLRLLASGALHAEKIAEPGLFYGSTIAFPASLVWENTIL